MTGRPIFRMVEDPLGPDALERPSREAVAEMWREMVRQPVPDYSGASLGPFLMRHYRARA